MRSTTRLNTSRSSTKYFIKNGSSNILSSWMMLSPTLSRSSFGPWQGNMRCLWNMKIERMLTLTSISTSKKPKTLSKREWTFPSTFSCDTNYTTSSENFKSGFWLQTFSSMITKIWIWRQKKEMNHSFSEIYERTVWW